MKTRLMSSDLPGFFQGTEMPDATWWQALFPNPAQILTLVGLAPGMDAVDLCSGDGWFTLPMAKIARHVMAVDIDAKMLAHASTRLTRDRITNCDYQLGDAYGLAEYVPRPVDFVFMANSFHGVPDRERLARIVGEALKPIAQGLDKRLRFVDQLDQRPAEALRLRQPLRDQRLRTHGCLRRQGSGPAAREP